MNKRTIMYLVLIFAVLTGLTGAAGFYLYRAEQTETYKDYTYPPHFNNSMERTMWALDMRSQGINIDPPIFTPSRTVTDLQTASLIAGIATLAALGYAVTRKEE